MAANFFGTKRKNEKLEYFVNINKRGKSQGKCQIYLGEGGVAVASPYKNFL